MGWSSGMRVIMVEVELDQHVDSLSGLSARSMAASGSGTPFASYFFPRFPLQAVQHYLIRLR